MIDPRELVGRWSLWRRLLDRRLAQSGTVRGTLVIEATGDGLSWSESGELSWAGQLLPVSRALRLREQDDGWWVSFSDGRPFHPWRPGQWVSHPCGADIYRGFVRADGPSLRILWEVAGPSKDQRILTRCHRAAAPARPVETGG